MLCYVRLMRKEDVAQVTDIDREAFPTLWPPANYHRELQNRLARYIVAYDEGRTVKETEVKAVSDAGLTRMVTRIKRLFGYGDLVTEGLASLARQYIVAFAGFWVMANEAHITNIAVRETYRRRGIGELLLIATIDMATEMKARLVTLEVRASNTVAQKLYYKHGFTQVGLHRGYYTDDREDAVLMSVENITSASFQAHLQQLKDAYSRRWGIAFRQLVG